MALIACPECGKDISTKAETCPHCGAPIGAAPEVNATGTQIRTIQETSKRLKTHILISAILFWGGFVWMFLYILSARTDGDSPSILTYFVATIMILTGLIWYIVTKARIWWHHK